MTRVSVVGR